MPNDTSIKVSQTQLFLAGYPVVFTGARIPTSDFTALPVNITTGSVFISSLSKHLHYVDQTGSVRFITGKDTGATSLPDGRIIAKDPTCTADGTNPFLLTWAYGGRIYESPLGEGIMPIADYTVYAGFVRDDQQFVAYISPGANGVFPTGRTVITLESKDTTTGDGFVTLYTGTKCSGTPVEVQWTHGDLSLTNTNGGLEGQTVYSGQIGPCQPPGNGCSTTGDYKSFKITAGNQMYITTDYLSNQIKTTGSAFCDNYDTARINPEVSNFGTVDWGVCYNFN
jgi:hypothetical protein